MIDFIKCIAVQMYEEERKTKPNTVEFDDLTNDEQDALLLAATGVNTLVLKSGLKLVENEDADLEKEIEDELDAEESEDVEETDPESEDDTSEPTTPSSVDKDEL